MQNIQPIKREINRSRDSKEVNYYRVMILVFFAWILYVFPFGWYNPSLINVVPPKPGFFVTYSSVFLILRQVSVILIILSIGAYAFQKKTFPKVSPIVHILAVIHLMIAFKAALSGSAADLAVTSSESFGDMIVNDISAFLGPSGDWLLNIPILYALALFCEILVPHLNYQTARNLSLGSLVAIALTAYAHLDFGNAFNLFGRYQFQYGNPNHAGVGLVSAMMLFLSFHKVTGVRNFVITWFLIFGVFSLVALTGSRTALTGLFLFLILRYAKLSLIKSAVLIALAAFVLVYASFLTDVFSNRDNRVSMWVRLFSHYSYDLITGADFEIQQGFVEGFFVTLPYTLGLIGFLIALIFALVLSKIIYASYGLSKYYESVINFGPFFIAFSWFSLFESVYLGVLTPGILIFLFITAWLRKTMRSKELLI